MSENEAFLKVLEIYSNTNDPVSQKFLQGLCTRALSRIKELKKEVEEIKEEIIAKVDKLGGTAMIEKIKQLNAVDLIGGFKECFRTVAGVDSDLYLQYQKEILSCLERGQYNL